MDRKQSRRNGQPQQPFNLEDYDPFADWMTDANFPSVIKELVHPGEDPDELFMRCFFNNEQQLNAAVLFDQKCEEFSIGRGRTLLRKKMAGSVSIDGQSRLELIQAHAKVISNALNKRGKGTFFSRRKYSSDDEEGRR